MADLAFPLKINRLLKIKLWQGFCVSSFFVVKKSIFSKTIR